MVGRIISVNIKITGDDELVRCGCSKSQEITEVLEKSRVCFGKCGRQRRAVDVVNG